MTSTGWQAADLEALFDELGVGEMNAVPPRARQVLDVDVEPEPLPDGLPVGLRERIDEEPVLGRRSHQHFALIASAMEAGYSDGQIVTMVLHHRPSTEKYGGRATGAALWVIAKLRAKNNGSTSQASASAASTSSASSASMDELLAALRTYLHLESVDHVWFALAVATSAQVPTGEPLWGMVVGAASSGKTEIVRMVDDVAHEHPDELTHPSLLSWSRGKEPKQVGILSRIPSPGLLTVADFSTILSTSDRGGRDQLFSLLRRAYDGHVSRDLGNAHRALTWEGRLTLLAACTPAIDHFASHADALGPRWVYCRVPTQDTHTKRATGKKALSAGVLGEYRARARALAAAMVHQAAGQVPSVELGDALEDELVDVAIVTCFGRAGVERSGYGRREIMGMAIVEEPPRLAGQLGLLTRCLLALGHSEAEALAMARRCALDSIDQARLGALEVLAHKQATIGETARQVSCHRQVARFALEELGAIGIAECASDEEDDEEGSFIPRPWSLAGPDVELLRRVLRADPHIVRDTKSGDHPPNPPNMHARADAYERVESHEPL